MRLRRFSEIDLDEGRVADAEDDHDLLDEATWIQNTQNAYGAFIHVAVHHGLFSAILYCGYMVMLAVVVQLIFAYYLWSSSPAIQDTLFCSVPQPLQIASIGDCLPWCLS
jgi:hypothetical protein